MLAGVCEVKRGGCWRGRGPSWWWKERSRQTQLRRPDALLYVCVYGATNGKR